MKPAHRIILAAVTITGGLTAALLGRAVAIENLLTSLCHSTVVGFLPHNLKRSKT